MSTTDEHEEATPMGHETDIFIDPHLPQIRITREFDAPPDRVFRAHIEPDLIVRWLGPRDLVMELDHWDAQTGGAYRYVHRRGDDEFWFRGSFHEVRAVDRIVQTFTYEGFPDSVALEKAHFESLEGDRTRLVVTSMGDSFEERDAMVASGMEHGVREGYERLDEVLAG